MKRLLGLLLLGCGVLYAAPTFNTDLHTAFHPASPFTAAVGGLNLTYAGDPGIFYGNPAALAGASNSSAAITFSVEHQKSASDLYDTSNLLRKKHVDNIEFCVPKAMVAWQPLIDTHSYSTTDGVSRYQDYSLQCFSVGFGDQSSSKRLSYSATLKYLWGRQVYKETSEYDDSLTVLREFVDHKVNGFSSDLGMTIRYSGFKLGLAAYDVYSHLYWNGRSDSKLQQRAAASMQFGDDSTLLFLGVLGKLDHRPEATLHAGLDTALSSSTSSKLHLRLGVWSHNFKNSDVIYTSFGAGYVIGGFTVATSLTVNGMKISNGDYLISLGMGI